MFYIHVFIVILRCKILSIFLFTLDPPAINMVQWSPSRLSASAIVLILIQLIHLSSSQRKRSPKRINFVVSFILSVFIIPLSFIPSAPFFSFINLLSFFCLFHSTFYAYDVKI